MNSTLAERAAQRLEWADIANQAKAVALASPLGTKHMLNETADALLQALDQAYRLDALYSSLLAGKPSP